ncbi:Uncharacterised protein (plasmid) [Legionella adelaidensis]|uniref:DUF4365 domain-containing protein n=1 Tax=Legionella adelaidensis TaxID=45056 RepID=A0A0W0R5K0_9GAMM|nr:hypothetical protein [Legionella adelaidensis]KTC66372.1 hypothetical protein Lade_1030 [Legionella adelaidensis]VEH84970.1 Uncharacterised protein [Legionella adelaidensis]
MTNVSQKIGKLAEKYFSIWCTEAEFVINQSIEDETGWDFFVEDSNLKQTTHQTIHEPEYTYFFQVKSTAGRARKVNIHLGNLYRLAKSPIPCFFIFMVFNSRLKPSKVYLKHLDKSLISEILKRVAKAIKNDEFNILHKKTLQIKFEEDNCLQLTDGSQIRAFIAKEIGKDYLQYRQDKEDFLKNSGYEDGFGNFNLGFENEADIIEFTHLFLGIKESIQLKKGSLLQKRFGYIFRNISADNAKLEISPPTPSHMGVLYLYKDNLPTQYNFSVKHYILDFNHLLDEKYRLNRIAWDYFDILYNPSNNNAQFIPNFNNSTNLNILEFIKYANLFNKLQSAGNEAKLYINNKCVFTIRQNNSSEPLKLIDIETLECLVRSSIFFPCLIEEKPSLEQVDKLKIEINLLDKIISFRPFEINLHFETDVISDMSDYYMFSNLTFKIGQSTIILVSVLTGKAKKIGINNFKFIIQKTNIERAMSAFEPLSTFHQQSSEELKKYIVEKYDDLPMIIL